MAELPVILTVRGTIIPKDHESARVLHNETAGSPPGIAAARSLGDLSHRVFTPTTSRLSSAAVNELFFLDVWQDPRGVGEFFSNQHVIEQAGKMFSARDAAIWMPARGAYAYRLPPPRGTEPKFLATFRVAVKAPEAAIAAWNEVDAKLVRDARLNGICSHELYVKLPMPGDDGPSEILATATFSSLQGLEDLYSRPGEMDPVKAHFAGPPAPAVWEVAPGRWNEW